MVTYLSSTVTRGVLAGEYGTLEMPPQPHQSGNPVEVFFASHLRSIKRSSMLYVALRSGAYRLAANAALFSESGMSSFAMTYGRQSA